MKVNRKGGNGEIPVITVQHDSGARVILEVFTGNVTVVMGLKPYDDALVALPSLYVIALQERQRWVREIADGWKDGGV